MNIFKRFWNWFTRPIPAAAPSIEMIQVKCNRCGEILPIRVNMMNDLSVEYNDRGDITGYFCRKVAQGKGMCFQTIEASLTYSPARILISHIIQGGTLVEE